jgi:UTP:GlnB (protein PII) uridylyltransferase
VGGYVTEGDIKSELRDAIEPVTQALSSVQQYMDILARHKLSEASISDLAQAEACLERVRAELHVAHTRNLLQHAKDNVERFEKDLKSYE